MNKAFWWFMLLFWCSIWLLLSSCHGRNVVIGDPVIRDGYAFRQDTPNTYIVMATSQDNLKKARKEIGCGVCVEEVIGHVYQVTRVQ